MAERLANIINRIYGSLPGITVTRNIHSYLLVGFHIEPNLSEKKETTGYHRERKTYQDLFLSMNVFLLDIKALGVRKASGLA